MGTFVGHILPGSFFAALAIYWAIRVFQRCLQSDGVSKFRSSATFGACKCCSCCPSYNYEAILKIVAVVIGTTGEIITAFENGHFEHLGNAQHATMFIAFGITGVVDLLVYHNVRFIVDGTDYAATVLALAVEGVLFTYHLHGMTSLETHLHKILSLIILCNIGAVLLEMQYRTNPLATCTRIYFFLLQGTWFWQIAFILYSPFASELWNGEDHENMMITTMYFAWHILGVLLGLIGIAGIVTLVARRHTKSEAHLMLKVHGTVKSNGVGEYLLVTEQDSDQGAE